MGSMHTGGMSTYFQHADGGTTTVYREMSDSERISHGRMLAAEYGGPIAIRHGLRLVADVGADSATDEQVAEMSALADSRDLRFYDENRNPSHSASEAMAEFTRRSQRDPAPIAAAIKLAAPHMSAFDAADTILRLRKLPRL